MYSIGGCREALWLSCSILLLLVEALHWGRVHHPKLCLTQLILGCKYPQALLRRPGILPYPPLKFFTLVDTGERPRQICEGIFHWSRYSRFLQTVKFKDQGLLFCPGTKVKVCSEEPRPRRVFLVISYPSWFTAPLCSLVLTLGERQSLTVGFLISVKAAP